MGQVFDGQQTRNPCRTLQAVRAAEGFVDVGRVPFLRPVRQATADGLQMFDVLDLKRREQLLVDVH